MTGITADPYWWQAAPPQDFRIGHWPELADVVIISSGYTGFGAAIPLARAGLDVVNLERDQIGPGASTLNGIITNGNALLQPVCVKVNHCQYTQIFLSLFRGEKKSLSNGIDLYMLIVISLE